MTITLKVLRSPFVPKTQSRRNRTSFYRTPRSTQINKGKTSNIKVCIRIRPVNDVESTSADSRIVVRPLDNKILVFDPYEAPPERYYKGQIVKDLGVRRNKDLKLAFDFVFDSSATNNDVFELTTKNMLDHLMDGVNCSIFAYGATGAGKTHTMLGTYESPGVISKTMNELYSRIEAVKDDLICSVEVSYLEIYNETVRDLLNPDSGQLAIREDGGFSLTIAGLTQHKPKDATHLFNMLESGNRNRTQHPTDANKESSRSHAIFQVHLKQSPRNAGLSNDVLVSKMVLVDLAGSERATATRNCGDRMREGANINRSLLALGNCINALAEGKKGAHIPYRDSKLTRILKDALGGNCHTLMIANVSPSYLSYDDTQNTLKYADRAKHIKADLRKNVFRVDQHIHQYGKIVQDLQAEVEELKAKYKQSQISLNDVMKQKSQIQCELDKLKSRQASLYSCKNESNVENVRDRLISYIELQKQILNNDSQKKILQLKINTRDEVQSFLNLLDYDPTRNEVWVLESFTGHPSGVKDLCRTKRIKSQYETKMHRINEELVDLHNSLQANSSELGDSLERMCIDDISMSENPAILIKESKCVQFRALAAHYESLFKFEYQKSKHMEKVINISCSLNREQHLILSSYDRLTSSLKTKFEDLIKLIERHRDISWKDDEDSEAVNNENLTLEDYSLNAPNVDIGIESKGSCILENHCDKENVDNDAKAFNLDSTFLMPANRSQPARSTLKPIENLNRSENRKSPPTRTFSCNGYLAPTPRSINKIIDDDIFKRPAIPPARSLKPYLPPPPPPIRPNSRSPNYGSSLRINSPGLQKSPSFSNLKSKPDNVLQTKMKKTISTSSLWRH